VNVLKFVVDMQELLKCTEESDPEHQKLTQALAKLQNVVAAVNEKRQMDEEVEAFAKIISQLHKADRFGVKLMVPGRKFIQEGSLLQSVVRTPCSRLASDRELHDHHSPSADLHRLE
jgi:hypothetical protein